MSPIKHTLSRSKQRFLLLAFVLWICYTVTLSLIKVPENQNIGRFHLDIAFHFSSYFVMAVLGASLIRWFVLIPTLTVAGATELIQRLLPHRTASWSDFGINVVGMTLGLVLWWFLLSHPSHSPPSSDPSD